VVVLHQISDHASDALRRIIHNKSEAYAVVR
jgi:hypothetical protein